VGVVQVRQGLDLAGVGVFGGVDLAQSLGQGGGLLVAAGLIVGDAGGQVGGEQGGAVGAEDALGEELADDFEQGVFADGDAAGVVFRGGVARVGRVVVAGVVGVAAARPVGPVAR
jgi:hypothetical protein